MARGCGAGRIQGSDGEVWERKEDEEVKEVKVNGRCLFA